MRPATTNIMNSILLTLVALSLACGAVSKPAESQLLLDGVWEGQIEMLVMRKRIIIRFANEQGKLRATLDAPTSFTEGFPLRDLEVNAATIRFSMGPRPESDGWRHLPLLVPDSANKGAKLEFEGKIEGDSIRGKITGVPFPGAFHLRRSRAQTQAEASAPRDAEWGRKERDYWPTREWKTAALAAEGIDPRGLAEAERVILENKPVVDRPR